MLFGRRIEKVFFCGIMLLEKIKEDNTERNGINMQVVICDNNVEERRYYSEKPPAFPRAWSRGNVSAGSLQTDILSNVLYL